LCSEIYSAVVQGKPVDVHVLQNKDDFLAAFEVEEYEPTKTIAERTEFSLLVNFVNWQHEAVSDDPPVQGHAEAIVNEYLLDRKS